LIALGLHKISADFLKNYPMFSFGIAKIDIISDSANFFAGIFTNF